ncbi:MAG: cyclic nucleotide-binding domain-containing protein [Anaerolineales bacterium]|nr:cyclic nucleotide-binding domain-containing protein [Anaerolineales bacterium]
MISSQVLRRFPNFAGLSEDDLKKVASISHLRNFESGEKLFREGNTAHKMMFLMFGEIHIVYQLGDGREVVADTLVAGDPLAWSALLEPHKLTASGVANKPGALLEIEAEALRSLCEQNLEFGYTMMKEVAKTLRSRLSAMRVQAAVTQAGQVEVAGDH